MSPLIYDIVLKYQKRIWKINFAKMPGKVMISFGGPTKNFKKETRAAERKLKETAG